YDSHPAARTTNLSSQTFDHFRRSLAAAASLGALALRLADFHRLLGTDETGSPSGARCLRAWAEPGVGAETILGDGGADARAVCRPAEALGACRGGKPTCSGSSTSTDRSVANTKEIRKKSMSTTQMDTLLMERFLALQSPIGRWRLNGYVWLKRVVWRCLTSGMRRAEGGFAAAAAL